MAPRGSPNRRRSRSLAAAAGAGRRRASAGDCSGGSRRHRATRADRNSAQIDPRARRCARWRADPSIAATIALVTAALVAAALVSAAPAGAQPSRTSRRHRPRAPCTRTARTTAGCSAANGSTGPTPSNVGRPDGWWRNVASTDGLVAGDGSQLVQRRRSQRRQHGRLGRLVPARLHAAERRLRDATSRQALPQLDHQLPVGQLLRDRVAQRAQARAPTPVRICRSSSHSQPARSGVNRLIVRVDDRRTPADLPQGPSGGWWNFGGINQEVYLRSVQRADLTVVQVRPILPCPTCAATIEEQATVTNPTSSLQTVELQRHLRRPLAELRRPHDPGWRDLGRERPRRCS